jgi:hypothetical protein
MIQELVATSQVSNVSNPHAAEIQEFLFHNTVSQKGSQKIYIHSASRQQKEEEREIIIIEL